MFALQRVQARARANAAQQTNGQQMAMILLRHFHLADQESTTFLKSHLSDISIRLQSSKEGHVDSKTSKAIKVLLHADRRPKSVPPFRCISPIKTHFGPALLGCHESHLQEIDESKLGKGDLGILQLQSQQSARVVDLPIMLEDGLKLDKAFGFLLRMAPIAGMSVPEPLQWKAAEVLQRIYKVFSRFEGIWFTFELGLDQDVSIIKPFLEFDEFALGRLPELKESFQKRQRDENTAMAEDGGLFYINLPNDGSVGSFGYGAGNAMATMDGLAIAGGTPANFLDGGGGANKANSQLAIETLNRDPKVKSIFVNTFGGLTQTDVVAEGIIEAVRKNDIKKPIVVRVLGTGADRAKQLLQESGLGFSINDDFVEAAKLAVKQSR